MSEFSSILKLVGKVVKIIYETTINIFFGILLVVSTIAIWRIPEIIRLSERNEKWSNFCCTSLFLSIADIIFAMSIIIIICLPLRWKQVRLVYINSHTREPFEYRKELLQTSMDSIIDLFRMLIGLLSLLSLYGRQGTNYYALSYLMNYTYPTNHDTSSYYNYRRLINNHIMKIIFCSGISSIIDLLFITLSVTILFVPHVWVSTYKGWNELRMSLTQQSILSLSTNTTATTNIQEYHRHCMKHYENIRIHFLGKSLQAIIDILVFPFFIIACLSPIRSYTLWNAIHTSNIKYANYKTYQEIIQTSNPRRYPSSTTSILLNVYLDDSLDGNYDRYLRKQCVILGILAISDIFLLPMLVCLYLTRYRYNAIKHILWPSSQHINNSNDINQTTSAINNQVDSRSSDIIINTHDILITTTNDSIMDQEPSEGIKDYEAQLPSTSLEPQLPEEQLPSILEESQQHWNGLSGNLTQNNVTTAVNTTQNSDLFTSTICYTIGMRVEINVDASANSIWHLARITSIISDDSNDDGLKYEVQYDAGGYDSFISADFLRFARRYNDSAITTSITPLNTTEITSIIPNSTLSNTNKWWGMEEFQLILKQTSLLFVDVFILLLPLPILWITSIRWIPVKEVLYKDDMFLNNNLLLYRAIVLNLICILHDGFLLLPAVLLLPCLLGCYRIPIVRYILQEYFLLTSNIPEPSSNLITQSYSWRNTVKVRLKLWKQCLETIFDMFFIIPGVIVLISLWRSWELYCGFRYLYTFHIQTQDESNSRYEMKLQYFISSFRSLIITEFFYLIRDVLCMLVPGTIVIGTIYRLPQFLSEVISTICTSGGQCLKTNPLFEIDTCHIEFPEHGGPNINFSCHRSIIPNQEGIIDSDTIIENATNNALNNNDNISQQDLHTTTTTSTTSNNNNSSSSNNNNNNNSSSINFDTSSIVELHVIDNNIWDVASQIFGQVLVAVLNSFLPVKLQDSVSIGWSEFVQNEFIQNNIAVNKLINHTSTTTTTVTTTTSTIATSQEEIVSLWLKLDFGTTKRRTILKKLKLLPPSTVIALQLETYITTTSNNNNNNNNNKISTNNNKEKIVLIRLKPTVQHLIDILISQQQPGTGLLPTTVLNKPLYATSEQIFDKYAPENRAKNTVNSFHMIVSKLFIEVLIDLSMFLMVFITIISPIRFLRLLYALLEPEQRFSLRAMQHAVSMMKYADIHLINYRKAIYYPTNQFAKIIKHRYLGYNIVRSDMYYGDYNTDAVRFQYEMHKLGYAYFTSYINTIDEVHFYPYLSVVKNINKVLASSTATDCEEMNKLFQERLHLHFMIIAVYFIRVVADLTYRSHSSMIENSWERNNRNHTVDNETKGFIDKNKREVVEVVLIEEHDRIVCKLNQNEIMIKELIRKTQIANGLVTDTAIISTNTTTSGTEQTQPLSPLTTSTTTNVAITNHQNVSLYKTIRKQIKTIGLLTRPIKESRIMITIMFMQALQEIGFVFLLLLLVSTVVRTIPLIHELWDSGTCSPLKYTTKLILIKHAKQLAKDILSIIKFIICTIIVFGFIGGIPSYLRDVGFHLETYQIAANFAMKHAKKSFFKLLEVLTLITAFRTYRIIIKSCLYCLIIPGACLAEANPLVSFSASIRFTIGMLIWFGLLAGSIVITCSVEYNHSYTAFDTRNALLAIGSAMFGILLISALSVANRPIYNKPDINAINILHFNWNHIFALLTGPIESIQLSAVILYFFWNHARHNNDSGSNVNTALGSDSFSATLLIWGNNHMYSNKISGVYYDTGKKHSLNTSVMIACLLVMIWAIIVSIPLVWSSGSGSDREYHTNYTSSDINNKLKVMKFKNSPLIEFITVLLSRLLPVWIMATLMRSTSCLDINTAAAATVSVISTSQDVECSGNKWWSINASLSLLLFYILTTSILNADEADLLKHNFIKKTKTNIVKFSPLYALCIRSTQFFICTACFTGFYTESIYIPLIPILIMSSLCCILPFIVQICSLSFAGMMRTGGFLCVSWTVIFCMIRESNTYSSTTTSIWESESNLYIGWGIIYTIIIIIAIYQEYLIRKTWEENLYNSGLLETIELFIQFLQENSDLNLLPSTHKISFASLSQNKKINNNELLNYYINQVKNAKNPQQLARLIIIIEESIMADRLSDDFLQQRDIWIEGLLDLQAKNATTTTTTRDNSTTTIHQSNQLLASTAIPSENRIRIITNQTTTAITEDNSIVTSFEKITLSLNILKTGIISSSHTIHCTRNIFTILLSYRLPREICWLIFEYFMISKEIKHIILSKISKDNIYISTLHNRTTPIRSLSEQYSNIKYNTCLIEKLIIDSDTFLSNIRRDISQAVISQTLYDTT